LIELLRRAAADDPGRPAVVTDDGQIAYADLVARSEALAVGLQARGIERAAVVTEDAATVVALLAAGSLSGTEICQYAPTDDPDVVRGLAERFDHDVVLTDRPALGGLPGAIDPAALAGDPADAPADPPDPRPLLVLTTGTTGAPKGARHDWNRVLRAASRVRPGSGQRWLLAYGLHQFAGLQILVHVMAAGATLVAPDERRPQAGLDAIRRHDVRHISATPTWWRFLLASRRATDGEAPPLEQITLGGEAAPDSLLAELAETFPGAQITHVFAATEFGSTGSVRDGQGGFDVAVLKRGDDADIAMKVVDGELWIRSRVGMLGYYGEEPVDPEGWRPTGDLVEIVGDRVLFRGRTTEVINVGGVKVHPVPIEDLVSRVPGVELARVFGRPNKLTGAVVAIELVVSAGADPEAVVEAVRDACDGLPAASRPRSVKVVDELATLGGKLTRQEPTR
jgi:acyl-CoA synthetase (AMP-forming)/AMP-acid ligase II